MIRNERRRLTAAYGRAWARRVRDGNADPELIRAELRDADLSKWVDDAGAWSVVVGFWNDGVPPNKLTGAALAAMKAPLRQIFGTYGEIRRLFK